MTDIDSGFYAGGRWERILRATADHALTATEILDALDDGRYSRGQERRKIHTALHHMAREGLMVRLPGPPISYIATALGSRRLAEAGQADEHPLSSDRFGREDL